MITTELLHRAGEESVKFIDNMHPNELGIFTLRKAFEMGYIHGANDTLKDIQELTDWESVAADQAMTIAMLKAKKDKPYQFEANMYSNDRMQIDATTGNICMGTSKQSEWVGLTNDEILEIDQSIDDKSYSMFAYTRAIEAKLKEKNT
jgi:hypothetical protein